MNGIDRKEKRLMSFRMRNKLLFGRRIYTQHVHIVGMLLQVTHCVPLPCILESYLVVLKTSFNNILRFLRTFLTFQMPLFLFRAP